MGAHELFGTTQGQRTIGRTNWFLLQILRNSTQRLLTYQEQGNGRWFKHSGEYVDGLTEDESGINDSCSAEEGDFEKTTRRFMVKS